MRSKFCEKRQTEETMTITFILGTRAEVIKLAPIIQASQEKGVRVNLIHTGQQTALTEPLIRFFRIEENAHRFINLQVMVERPSLAGLSARVLERLDHDVQQDDTDWIIVQGDSISAFIGAYWGFCRRIPVAHVEAGLRTGDIHSPFPQEAHRIMIARLADLHFAPTTQSMQALLNEGVEARRIYMTGNTSIDALKYTLHRIETGGIPSSELTPTTLERFIGENRLILVAAHSPENIGEPLSRICKALRALCDSNPRIRMVAPLPPNPAVKAQTQAELGQHPQILLHDNLNYIPFVQLMKRADVILTDLGGVQEEGPTLKKPIVVVREGTERPEGVESGFARLTGADTRKIFEAVQIGLHRGIPAEKENPYGDGRAAQRILAALALGGSGKQTVADLRHESALLPLTGRLQEPSRLSVSP
jgi:UDP-N-acetylglucosamine 2-epimerase (non-hydrolysing)